MQLHTITGRTSNSKCNYHKGDERCADLSVWKIIENLNIININGNIVFAVQQAHYIENAAKMLVLCCNMIMG